MLDTIYDIQDMRNAYESGESIGGHIWTKSALDAGFTRIRGVVREPRSRLLSLYRYWQAENPEILLNRFGAKGRFVLSALEGDFEYFLRAGQGQLDIDNGIARYLGALTEVKRRDTSQFDVRFYWTTELDLMVTELAGVEAPEPTGRVPRLNVTHVKGIHEELTPAVRSLLHQRTKDDSSALKHLMKRGWANSRSRAELDGEFESTLQSLDFSLG
jgi:hypothetical protein